MNDVATKDTETPRRISKRWKASVDIEPFWTVRVAEGQFDILCITYYGDDEEHAKHIAACHNGCLGINPEAVPKMLEALNGLDAALLPNADVCADSDHAYWISMTAVKAVREVIALAEKQ